MGQTIAKCTFPPRQHTGITSLEMKLQVQCTSHNDSRHQLTYIQSVIQTEQVHFSLVIFFHILYHAARLVNQPYRGIEKCGSGGVHQ